MVKFDKRIVAKILIFQLVNFDFLKFKNDYLNSEKRICWIARVKKMTYIRLRDQTNSGNRIYEC